MIDKLVFIWYFFIVNKKNLIHDCSPEKNDQLTIRDIARLSGVSTATVSRLFHTPHLVKEATRNKIEAVINEYQYIPNQYASALTTKNTMTIGLIIPTVKSSIHSALIQSIQDTCSSLGYSVIIGNTNYSVDVENSLLGLMLSRRVSGIIHAGTVNPGFISKLRHAAERGIPSVVVWETIEDEEISSVGIDNFTASYDAASYLISRGHTQIGLLIGPYHTMNRLDQRLRGFRLCMKEHGLPQDESRIITLNHEVREGVTGTAELLKRSSEVTAIFAASDVLAFGALYQLQQSGYRVPDDISVIGFDNIELSSYCLPPLTTINVPAAEMGNQAVLEMTDRINTARLESKHYRLNHKIIIRDSVAPPRNS